MLSKETKDDVVVMKKIKKKKSPLPFGEGDGGEAKSD